MHLAVTVFRQTPAASSPSAAAAAPQVVEAPVEQLKSQDPSFDDIAAAMTVVNRPDSSLGEDEEADVALTAFDHMVSGFVAIGFAFCVFAALQYIFKVV